VGYNYVVFGAGKVGQAVIFDLVENCEADKVLLIDPDEDALDRVHNRFNLYVCNDILYTSTVCWACDLRDQYDVVISCAPYHCNLDICNIATGAGLPFLDLGGNQKASDEIACHCHTFKVETPVITDCGLAPGICNMFAAYLAGRYGCKDIDIVCGGIPAKRPNNNVYHISAFSPEGLKSEYFGNCPCIIDGDVDFICATTSMAVPYGREYETFYTSNNSFFTAEYLHNLGVQNYKYQTLRWSGHGNAMLGRSTDEIPFGDHEDKVIINVTGKTRGRITGFHAVVYGSDGFTAMAKTTALGITTVAHYVARGGKTRSGFQTPEQLWSKHDLMNRIFEIFDIDAR